MAPRVRLRWIVLALAAFAIGAGFFIQRQSIHKRSSVGPHPAHGLAPAAAASARTEHDTAASGTGVAGGRIVWFESGDPAAGVPVLADAPGHEALRGVSGADGSFVIDGLAAAVQYSIHPLSGPDGPFAFEARTVTVGADQLVEHLKLRVWKGAIVSGNVQRIDKSPDFAGGDILSEEQASAMMAGKFRVVDKQRPLAGVQIRLKRMPGPIQVNGPNEKPEEWELQAEFSPVCESPEENWELITDAAGHFEFPPIPTGRYFIEAVPPPGIVTDPKKPLENSTTFIALPGKQVGPYSCSFRFGGLRLEGRVVDSDGRPIIGASVKAAMVTSSDEDFGSVRDVLTETTTDSAGKYAFDALAEPDPVTGVTYLYGGRIPGRGAYAVQAAGPGFAPAQVVVPMLNDALVAASRMALDAMLRETSASGEGAPGGANPGVLPESRGRVITAPVISLGPAAGIEGVVVDTAGRLQSGVQVRPVVENDPLLAMEIQPVRPAPAEADGNGRFRIEPLAPGEYDFRITHENRYEKAIGGPFMIEAGARSIVLTLTIPAPSDRGSIHGRVVDPSGRPVDSEDVRVQFLDAEDAEDALGDLKYGNRVTTGLETGEFLLETVSPGVAQVLVKVDGFPAQAVRVQVAWKASSRSTAPRRSVPRCVSCAGTCTPRS